jgi:hypothetical protein
MSEEPEIAVGPLAGKAAATDPHSYARHRGFPEDSTRVQDMVPQPPHWYWPHILIRPYAVAWPEEYACGDVVRHVVASTRSYTHATLHKQQLSTTALATARDVR